MNGERSRQAEGTAGAKAMRWGCAGHDQGTSRWGGGRLEQQEGIGVVGEIGRRWGVCGRGGPNPL